MKKYLKIYFKETLCLLIIIVLSLLNMKKAYFLDAKYINCFIKELSYIIVGIIIYISIYKINFKYIFKSRYFLYFLNIFLLLYVLLFSKEINHIKAWINLGFISFQPSELIKFTYPLIAINLNKNKKYFLSILYFIIPSILILIEPDTGNFILLLIIFLFLIYNKKTKKLIKFIMFIFFISITSLLIIFNYNKNILIKLFNGSLYYRFNRIINYKNNLQIKNSLIGIGSSNLLPINKSKILIYIPEGITDFAFAFFIQNYGIILTLVLLISYFCFIYFLYNKYIKKRNYYEKRILGSFLIIISFQSIYNILMNIGLLPIIGIPLPFFSYGGSNIITYIFFYALATKKGKIILDKDNNNYKNNYHKVLGYKRVDYKD